MKERNHEKILYAAIRYLLDKKVHICCVSDIKNFKEGDTFEKPYYIKRINAVTKEEEFEPGQILNVSADKKELKKNKKRYKFMKMRRSDALEILAKESDTEDTEDKIESITAGASKKIQKDENKPQKKKKNISTKLVEVTSKKHELTKKINADKENFHQNILENKVKKVCSNLEFSESSKLKKKRSHDKTNKFIEQEKAEDVDNDKQNLKKNLLTEKLKYLASYNLQFEKENKDETNSNKSSDSEKGEVEDEIEENIEETEKRVKRKDTHMIGNNDEGDDNVGFSMTIENKSILSTATESLSRTKPKEANIFQGQSRKDNLPQKESDPDKLEEIMPTNEMDESKIKMIELEEKLKRYELLLKDKDQEIFNLKEKLVQISSIINSSETPTKRNIVPIISSTPKAKRKLFDIVNDNEENDGENNVSNDIREITSFMPNKKKATENPNTKEYDSDDYAISITDERRSNFTKWDKTVGDKRVTMYHICYGISIPYNEWKTAKQKRTQSEFVRLLSEYIWGRHDLMNRAIDIKKVTSQIPNRSPVKPCTPKKLGVLRRSYIHYLFVKKIYTKESFQKLDPKRAQKILNEYRSFLRMKINTLRGKQSENSSKGVKANMSSGSNEMDDASKNNV